MMSSVIGGAMLPHAPQFFTMPETEDRYVQVFGRLSPERAYTLVIAGVLKPAHKQTT